MDEAGGGGADGRRIRGKLWRHSCGYPLWAQVGAWFEPVPGWETVGMQRCVLVSYRSAVAGSSDILLSHCPGCGKRLRLWWPVPENREEAGNSGL